MTSVVALLVGILLGSLPTADWLGRRRGLELREQGSGNPGANNALQLGGPALGGAVLVIALAKGMVSVWLGGWLAGARGAALGGMGATLGNVYNPWHGLRGGKGLAITAGVVAAAWPALAAVLVVVIGVATAVLRRTGPASLLALAGYLAASMAGLFVSLPGRWGIVDPVWMATMATAQTFAMAPKHYADTVKPPGPPGSPAGS